MGSVGRAVRMLLPERVESMSADTVGFITLHSSTRVCLRQASSHLCCGYLLVGYMPASVPDVPKLF